MSSEYAKARLYDVSPNSAATKRNREGKCDRNVVKDTQWENPALGGHGTGKEFENARGTADPICADEIRLLRMRHLF